MQHRAFGTQPLLHPLSASLLSAPSAHLTRVLLNWAPPPQCALEPACDAKTRPLDIPQRGARHGWRPRVVGSSRRADRGVADAESSACIDVAPAAAVRRRPPKSARSPRTMAAQGPSRRRVSTQPSIRPAGELRQVANCAAGGTASTATGLSFFFSVFQRKKSTWKERAEERGRRRTRRRARAPTGPTRGRNGAHPNIGSHPWGRGAQRRRSSPEEEEEEEEESERRSL